MRDRRYQTMDVTTEGSETMTRPGLGVCALVLLLILGAVGPSAGAPAVLSTAQPTLSLPLLPATGQAMTVTWHTGFNQYYGIFGASVENPATVWDVSGTRLQTLSPSGFSSVYSIFYNANTNAVEMSFYNSQASGLYALGLDGSGLFTGARTKVITSLPGLPDKWAMPCYDGGRDRLYSRPFFGPQQDIWGTDRTTGAYVGTVSLDLATPAPVTLVSQVSAYDPLEDVFVNVDMSAGAGAARALVHEMNGAFVGAAALPGITVQAGYGFGYANGQLFIYDQSQNAWQGFRVFGTDIIPEPISMIFFGTGLVGVLGYARRRRLIAKQH